MYLMRLQPQSFSILMVAVAEPAVASIGIEHEADIYCTWLGSLL